MITSFNQDGLLREAIDSVVAQAPGPEVMQIEVIDDCSTQGDPQRVVEECGQGRVTFTRNETNMGATATFNECIRRSRGEFVHILHGDDLVAPGFYTAVDRLIHQHPSLGLYLTRGFIIDEDGSIEVMSQRTRKFEVPTRDPSDIYYQNRIVSTAAVIRREFYETHGGFDEQYVHVADWEMWLRAIHRAGAVMLDEPLIKSRVFAGNDTSRLARTAENLVDTLRLGEAVKDELPGFDVDRFKAMVVKEAREQSLRFGASGDDEAFAASAQLWWSLLDVTTQQTLMQAAVGD